MKDKKEKWEIQYEDYQNGGLDKKIEELKAKYENKEIDAKQYMKEQKQIDKIKTNLPKVEHLLELRNELKDLKVEIEEELVARENEKSKNENGNKLEDEMQKLDEENAKLLISIEETQKQLKNPNLSEQDKKELEAKLNKDNMDLNENNSKFMELNGKRKAYVAESRDTEISKMNDQDLKKNYQKICMKLSRNNFYAKRLLKGYDIESVKAEDKKIDWNSKKYDIDMKKLMAKGKEAEKMKSLRETAKEEKNIEKYDDNEMNKIQDELGKNVAEIIKENQNNKNLEMIEVDEFAQKHPRLAKIKQFFSNIKNKVVNKFGKAEEVKNNEQVLEEQNAIDEKIDSKEDKEKIESNNNKHRSFVKRLKDMNEYEIFDVAEKGMDGIRNEKITEANKKLQKNKEKHANGMEADEKKYWDEKLKSIDNNDAR